MYNQVQDEYSRAPTPSFRIRKSLFRTHAECVFPVAILFMIAMNECRGKGLDEPQSYVHSCRMDSSPGSSPLGALCHPSRIKVFARSPDSIFARSHSIPPSSSRSSSEGVIHLENSLPSDQIRILANRVHEVRCKPVGHPRSFPPRPNPR
jgi:hypothetical protein